MKRHHAILLTSLIAVAALMGQGTAVAATMGNGSSGPPDAAVKLEVGDPAIATETDREKIDIMGIWAHPDDDAGFTTPCGVWNDLYGVRCGIIMATRGEGGSNSVGPEAGPDLGLRRENEDRTSHIRSGTVDIFNLDRVDFFYNTSAPLTAKVWDAEETLSRTVRIIRETRPEILVGSTPSLAAGHGNHQYAQGRMIWEAAAAAADPSMFPEQLTGVGAVDPWQVKKVLAGGLTTGTGGTAAPSCNAGFVPAATNPFTVVGTWTGYESPYVWAEGNLAGQAAGSAKTWAQVGREGGRAHPTQARTMQTALVDPTCQRYGVSQSIVPMQPNSSPASANDDAVLYGAVIADPGGMPLGSEFSLEAEEYFEAAGEPFTTTVTLRSGEGELGDGTVSLVVPTGWQVSEPVEVDGIGDADATQATFTVTPSGDAAPAVYKLAAEFAGDGVTAYNDTRIELVAPVEGRFDRWGTAAEYDEWTQDNDAYVGGRSRAVAKVGAGETVTVPVEVTNRTAVVESGSVELAVPAGFVVDATSKPFAELAPGETTTVPFVVTHTDPADPGSRTVTFTATTMSGAGVSSENETVYLVPTVVIPELDSAPAVDGIADELYVGQPIDVGTRWEGAECAADGVDCGDGGVARLGWYDDALYAQIRVTDDVASAASTPDRCFGHWLVDSVELLLDPRGDSIDTSSTFKLGMFPFTDDAEGANGNGADGPCWSRDADNHQGFSTGPLAETVEGGLNAEGVEVAVEVARQADGTFAGGGYDIEVKVPLSALPAGVGPTSAVPQGDAALNDVDPQYLGLNVTPYDSDTQNFIGQTRTAWSAFGSQQSEPYRWGHAYLDGYTPPADRPTESADPIIPDTALQGVQSPQTVAQSATRGGTISGVQPSDALTISDVKIQQKKVSLSYRSTEAGTVRVFLWKGDTSFIPVWTSSCVGDLFGFEACAPTDGAAPPWAPDMSGRLVASFEQAVDAGKGTLTVPIDAGIRSALIDDAQILVSFAEQPAGDAATGDGVNAWSFPIEATRPGKG
ncbi:NEW3 domain-containing protein [Agromyces cerinus]|uniref:NPCBM-associated, NEW3 domain of alpha-galactosidase n=1 Tax=Agromyces cerinus subsp. cerinus TaxID=232089 RepID=A0A1N6I4D2_9MICO|nr:NEW3 domain-containing protein [Agromyces cerinus]SIO26775.1 NPCBM-associated, NEW3 domain of alpha-galactosidase [Agromyces cerinus subsp. cerinus]